jgi:hypothetical protein
MRNVQRSASVRWSRIWTRSWGLVSITNVGRLPAPDTLASVTGPCDRRRCGRPLRRGWETRFYYGPDEDDATIATSQKTAEVDALRRASQFADPEQ